MTSLRHLFENNRKWAAAATCEDPEFFSRLVHQQSPEYLWIGCADSRVPANEIVGLLPGELFVHRNVANIVMHTDINCLSVLQYAVDILKVKHVIVCGHYGCGGVQAALDDRPLGLIDNWIKDVKRIHRHHRSRVDAIVDPKERLDLMCELNVREQTRKVFRTTIVQQAFARGQQVTVHGWIYGISNGHLKDLKVRFDD
jgi:carbonic anhydrase